MCNVQYGDVPCNKCHEASHQIGRNAVMGAQLSPDADMRQQQQTCPPDCCWSFTDCSSSWSSKRSLKMSSARGGAVGAPATKVPSRSSLAHTARPGRPLKAGSCQEGLLVCPATAATASALHTVHHISQRQPAGQGQGYEWYAKLLERVRATASTSFIHCNTPLLAAKVKANGA